MVRKRECATHEAGVFTLQKGNSGFLVGGGGCPSPRAARSVSDSLLGRALQPAVNTVPPLFPKTAEDRKKRRRRWRDSHTGTAASGSASH